MKEKILSESKRFSIVARAKSFTHAGRGVYIFLKSTHNAWIHLAFLFILLFFGFIFRISKIEWAILVMSSTLMIITEAINTAIEIDIDLTSPDYHPYARDTKDVAAGAVLITAIMAVVVNLIILLPYAYNFVKLSNLS